MKSISDLSTGNVKVTSTVQFLIQYCKTQGKNCTGYTFSLSDLLHFCALLFFQEVFLGTKDKLNPIQLTDPTQGLVELTADCWGLRPQQD